MVHFVDHHEMWFTVILRHMVAWLVKIMVHACYVMRAFSVAISGSQVLQCVLATVKQMQHSDACKLAALSLSASPQYDS